MGLRLQQRVPGSELRLLQSEPNPRPLFQVSSQLFGLMTNNDHHGRRVQRLRRGHDVVDERLTRCLMQNFGERGLHPRAFASCQDDDVEVWRTRIGQALPGTGLSGEP